MKCRTLRTGDRNRTVTYFASGSLRSCYAVSDGKARDIDYLEALKLLEASPDERSAEWTREAIMRNYNDVNAALAAYAGGAQPSATEAVPATASKNRIVQSALRFLRECSRWISQGALPEDIAPEVDALSKAINEGAFVQLDKAVSDMAKEYRSIHSPNDSQKEAIAERLKELRDRYCAAPRSGASSPAETQETPDIIISETFTA